MRYGLIGEKLGHSFSKAIHEQLADYTYDLIPLSKTEFLAFMEQKEFTAINVTIPYKKAVIPYLDEIDEHAKVIGAVNTIVQRNGKLCGYNTDFTGFLYMVKKHNIQMRDKKVLIIGNGGASAAIQAAVKHEHASEMLIVDIVAGEQVITYDECFLHHLDAQIIINTSPVGMYPKHMNTPLELSLFPNCEAVLDVIYNPLMTRLCYQANKRGMQYINGLEMLIAQAKYAVEYFLDRTINDSVIDHIYQHMKQERQNIILIGMPSAGKTTIGKALADKLHKDFIDMDEKIIKKAGMSIPEIFKIKGEQGFRALEIEIAIALSGSNHHVIATGGGIVTHAVNMELLKLNGLCVFIDRDLKQLISDDTNRPLSKDKAAVQQMYQQRLSLYQNYADIHVKNNADIISVVNNIEKALTAGKELNK